MKGTCQLSKSLEDLVRKLTSVPCSHEKGFLHRSDMWLPEAALHAEWLKQRKTLKNHCTPTKEFCKDSRERS